MIALCVHVMMVSVLFSLPAEAKLPRGLRSVLSLF